MPHGSQTRKLGWNLFRGASGMGRRHRGTSTPQDLLLPEGKLIRTTRGGPNALKQLLLDLKKYSFSGYVRTVRGGSGKRSEGIDLLRGGNPAASLYHRDGTQDLGRSALKKVWQDSYDESCILELHARVDMDGLVREYADSILERPAKVVKKTKIPQTMERSEIERQIRAWKGKGYDVSSVESNLDTEPSILAASVVAMRDGVKKAEAVGEMLAGLDVSGFESRAAILREKLKDPVRHPDIDTEVESLRDAVESLRQIEARRQVELERGRDSQERTRKVLDLVMKQQQSLRPEAGPYSTETSRGRSSRNRCPHGMRRRISSRRTRSSRSSSERATGSPTVPRSRSRSSRPRSTIRSSSRPARASGRPISSTQSGTTSRPIRRNRKCST